MALRNGKHEVSKHVFFWIQILRQPKLECVPPQLNTGSGRLGSQSWPNFRVKRYKKKKNPQPTKTFDSFIIQAWPRGIEQTSPFASIFHPFSTMPLRPKGHLPSGSKKRVISRPLSGTGSRQARDAIWTNVKKLYVPQT